MDGFDVPPYLEGFVDRHGKRPANAVAITVTSTR
jgi:hypothetical protein